MHGGALDEAIAKFGGGANDWLDLSTGINPYHYPVDQIGVKSWQQLPQKMALDNLVEIARKTYNCAQASITVGNGTQVLIEHLPQLFEKSCIAIMSPTYEEHAQNWQKHGHSVSLVSDVAAAKKADHLLIVNPNNPTGKFYSIEELQNLRQHFVAKGGCLIVDEAFIDIKPEDSMAKFAGVEGLVILRSFGKFYGLAGVRIGFMLSDALMAKKISQHIGLWAMSGMAIDVASMALADTTWQNSMRKILTQDMRDMINILQDHGFSILGKTSLFCLVSPPNQTHSAYKYFDKFAIHHILTRKFEKDDKILRFGLIKKIQQESFAEKLNKICSELAL